MYGENNAGIGCVAMRYETRVFQPEGGPVRNLGWIDNTITRFDTFMESFSKHSTRSYAAVSPQAYMRDFEGRPLDHLLLDYDMVNDTGFDCLSDVMNSCPVKNVYICTAYSYEEHIHTAARAKEKELGLRIGIVPKERLPYADQDDRVQDFLEALDEGRFYPLEQGLSPVERNGAGQLEKLTFEEYEQYTLQQRLAVLSVGRKVFADLIDKAFRDGVQWLAIDANTGIIVREAREVSEIPSSEWVDDYVEKKRAVLLIYAFGATLDSEGGGCGSTADLRGYPRITIRSAEGNGTVKEEVVHFDTGNSFTVLAYEYFLEQGWYPPIKNPQMKSQGGYDLYGTTVEMRDVTVTDSLGGSAVGNIKGFAVIEWPSHRFALRCDSACGSGVEYPAKENVVLCRRRVALLGRNLGAELRRRFMVDVVNGKMQLRRDEI